MSKVLFAAHRQWASRPPDERFPSLQSLYDFTGDRKRNSVEEIMPANGLKIYSTYGGAVAVNGNLPPSVLTNWSFGQLCALAGAPSRYLKTLTAQLAAQCLEYGVHQNGEEHKILIRKGQTDDDGNPLNLTAAFTGPNYGRIWDHEVMDNLMSAIEGSSWHPPISQDDPKDNSGLYASDRDMFVFLINDENPVEVENAKLGRGFFCWNSETGSATFGLTVFLYNYICANHIVWGAEQVKELRIIHRAKALNRLYADALPLLNRFVENRRLDDEIKDNVFRAMRNRLGQTQEQVFKWFEGKPFTSGELAKAWECGNIGGEDTTSLWGMVQGLTALARQMPHIDKRVNLERRAGALLN